MEFGNPLPYDINITGSNNKGFIVKTGCCTSVFTDKKEMLAAIADYINDPEKAEKEYAASNKNCPTNALAIDTQGVGMTIRTDNRHELMEDCDCRQEEQPDNGR